MITGIRGASVIDPAAFKSSPPSMPPTSTARTSGEDKVTLSSLARELHGSQSKDRGATSERAHADPQFAEEISYGYAHTEQSARLDISGLDSTGLIRYAATGEVVTSESEARFKEQAAALKAASTSLYEREKAKGTAAADIFDKLLDLVGSQPRDFRDAINWKKD